MNELVDFLIIFIAVAFLTRLVVSFLVWRIQKQIVHIAYQIESEFVLLDMEQDAGQYFCYNHKTKKFVCQGRDLEEVGNNFRIRYPDKRGLIFRENATELSELGTTQKVLLGETK
jgi:hypothetical protein